MPNATRKLHARICPKLSLQAHTERGNTHTLVVASHKVTWQSSLLRCVGLHKPPLDCGVGLFTSLLAMTRSMRRKWAVWFTLRFRDASHNAVIARHEVVWQSSQDRLTPRCYCKPVRAWQSSLIVWCGMPARPLRADECPIGSTPPCRWRGCRSGVVRSFASGSRATGGCPLGTGSDSCLD